MVHQNKTVWWNHKVPIGSRFGRNQNLSHTNPLSDSVHRCSHTLHKIALSDLLNCKITPYLRCLLRLPCSTWSPHGDLDFIDHVKRWPFLIGRPLIYARSRSPYEQSERSDRLTSYANLFDNVRLEFKKKCACADHFLFSIQEGAHVNRWPKSAVSG